MSQYGGFFSATEDFSVVHSIPERSGDPLAVEYVIYAVQACQSGQCDKKEAAKATPQVIVVEPVKTSPVIFLAPEAPRTRLALPKLFQRQAVAPVVVICPDGKCSK